MYNFQESWILGNFTQWIAQSNSFTFGPISLEHDLYNISVARAPDALDMVIKAGFNVRPVAECLSAPSYIQPIQLPPSTGSTLPPSTSTGSTANTNNSTPKTNDAFTFEMVSLVFFNLFLFLI